MSASPARVTALKIVSRVRERKAYSHEVADAVLKSSRDLDSRDRGLATRLAYGAIATSGTLDEALDRFIAQPGKVEPRVRDALEISAWELLFGGVEPHVAVSEGVELVRSLRPPAAGLANAVLRRLAEASPDFPWGEPSSDLAVLARLHGHPLWLTELLVADLGRPLAESVLAANNAPAPVYLAVLLPEKTDGVMRDLQSVGAEPETGPLEGSIRVGRPAALAGSSSLASGSVEVCDAAAQFTAHAVRPAPGMRIVEIGAGRGTKTLLLQSLARACGGDAEIWAIDSHAFKLEILAKRAADLGFAGIRTLTADATQLSELPETAALRGTVDAVLVDAPCSGLGTLRRHPDKRWRLRPADIDELASLSARLIAQAAPLVRPGGFVVYSTCTLTARENRDVVEGFLASNAGKSFELDDLSADVPDAWKRFVSEEGWFQSVPEVGGPDGHFVARLRHV